MWKSNQKKKEFFVLFWAPTIIWMHSTNYDLLYFRFTTKKNRFSKQNVFAVIIYYIDVKWIKIGFNRSIRLIDWIELVFVFSVFHCSHIFDQSNKPKRHKRQRRKQMIMMMIQINQTFYPIFNLYIFIIILIFFVGGMKTIKLRMSCISVCWIIFWINPEKIT